MVSKLRPLLPALGFFCGLLLAAIAAQNNVSLIGILVGAPGLHGVLIARSALRNHRQAKLDKKCLIGEFACGSFLVVASLMMLTGIVFYPRPIFPALAFFGGLLLAAIATLPLIITDVLKIIAAVRRKQGVWQNTLRLALNFLALLIYLVLLTWMSMLLLLMLSGEPYMGN
jgi:hypothetical protein